MSAEDTINDGEFYNDDAPPADLAAGDDAPASSDADDKWVEQALAALEDAAEGGEDYVTIPGTDGMLEMKWIKRGSGTAKRPKSGDHVWCHYHGTLTTGVVFDSSRTRGSPFEFDLAKSGVAGSDATVIKAWDAGVRILRRGDRVMLRSQPGWAYGARATGSIPPNSVLLFEIEVLAFGKKPVDVARDGTVMKKILSEGKGYKMPRYESKFSLSNVVLYRGADIDDVGAVIATKSVIDAVLGDVDLPPGFDFAIESMKEGEEAAITFHASDLAGAERFVNGVSDPAADAAAAAALAAGKTRSEVFTLRCTMGPFDVVQTWGGTAESKFESAMQRKEQGNRWVGEGLFARAVRKYERAIDFVGDPEYDAAWSNVDEDGRNEARALRAVCMSNMALCYLKLHNYKDALAKADEALKSDPTNAKARFRRCQALHALGEWTTAIAELQKLPQSDAAVAAELATLLAKKKADDERQKKVFSKMFA